MRPSSQAVKSVSHQVSSQLCMLCSALPAGTHSGCRLPPILWGPRPNRESKSMEIRHHPGKPVDWRAKPQQLCYCCASSLSLHIQDQAHDSPKVLQHACHRSQKVSHLTCILRKIYHRCLLMCHVGNSLGLPGYWKWKCGIRFRIMVTMSQTCKVFIKTEMQFSWHFLLIGFIGGSHLDLVNVRIHLLLRKPKLKI